MIEILKTILETAIFMYITYLGGSAILCALRINFETKALHSAYALICGFGAAGTIGLILALFGLFNMFSWWTIVIILLTLERKQIMRNIGSIILITEPYILYKKIKQIYIQNTILKLIITIWLLSNFIIAFVPLTGHDTLDYHLPIIENIAKQGDIAYGLSYTSIPFFGEIIYAIPTTMFGETTAPFVFQLIQWSTMPLLLILLYGTLSYHIENKTLRFLPVLLTLSIMDLWREVMHGGYVDLLTYMFGFSALFIIFNHALRKHLLQSRVILSGFLCGMSISVKYTGLFFIISIGLIGGAMLIKKTITPYNMVKLIALFTIALICTSSFWYIKNVHEYNNPVYPMFSDAQATSDINFFITNRNLSGYISFPYWRFGGYFYQTNETSSRLVILGYFIMFAILSTLSILMKIRYRNSTWLTILLFLLFYTLLFLSSHQIRFFLPALIMLAIALSFQIDDIYKWLKKININLYKVSIETLRYSMPIIFFFILLGNFHYFYVRWYYKLGILDKQEYIDEIGGQ